MTHTISSYSKLAEKKYTPKNVVPILYRVMCARDNLKHSKDWWVEPERVVRSDHDKSLWDLPIQTDKHLLHNRPDIRPINCKEQTGPIISTSVPIDKNI